jgi:SNF2 family DNA or RNA helicase
MSEDSDTDNDSARVTKSKPISLLDSASDTMTSGDDIPKRARSKQSTPDPGEKVDWSDDGDPEETYKAFKNRKSRKRKLAVAEGKRAKARTTTSTSVARGKQPIGSSTGVGKSVRSVTKDSKGKSRKPESAGNTNAEDQLDDEHIPEYVRKRKDKFEKLRNLLGNAGLKLPPDYDGIDFSDEDRMDRLQEKPVLPRMKPCASYKDIALCYSGGTVPAPIAQWLRDYQVKGVEFLHELFVWQRGGLLGDDMGLGKTIQVISFLTAAFGKTGDERDLKRMRKLRRTSDSRWYPRILIICPGGLMENWKSELDRWGWWQYYTYHGSVAEKESALQAAAAGRLEIMITTYTTYRMNMSAINTVDWDCVVADECHTLKGRSSEITQAMNNINALCRIGLTGTAIQNNYDELWTLLNWTNPGRFGSLASWKASISDPLRIGQAHDATSYQLGLARRTAKKLVNNLLPSFFLRRMKTLIADQLPKKSDRVVFCPLTDTQTDAYANYVDCDIVEYIRTSADPCSCSSGKKRGWCCYAEVPGFGKWQNHVFPAIVTLQKLANHLALLIPSGIDPVDKQSKDLENLQIVLPDGWKDLYRQRDSIMNFANQEFCGKWKILKRLLQFWHSNGDKVLVFSHSVRLLKMLQVLFTSTTSYTVSYLDGAMSYQDRAQAVDDFNANSSQFVFLISTRAGGVGLNITSANKVVVFDPNWNPSFDLQAQDRAYRIGQMRDVEVFRLVSAGTIEERVYARQIYKQQQANIGYTASSERRYFSGVQDQKEKKGEIFGLANLFSYQGEGLALKEIVNKTNVAESRMGVIVADVDMTQMDDDDDPLKGDDEDAAMSQLAALIIGDGDGKTKQGKNLSFKNKTDPVQAILASAGVEYTHENSEVIGTSKTEAKLSRKAAENTNTIEGSDRPIFTEESQVHFSAPGALRWRFRPPEAVRMRQFCSMSEAFGFADATEFALVVEGWTQEQRRNCLDKFYRLRREQEQENAEINIKVQDDKGVEMDGRTDDDDDGDDEL